MQLAAKSTILCSWLSPSPPTNSQLLSNIVNIRRMEHLNKIWEFWDASVYCLEVVLLCLFDYTLLNLLWFYIPRSMVSSFSVTSFIMFSLLFDMFLSAMLEHYIVFSQLKILCFALTLKKKTAWVKNKRSVFHTFFLFVVDVKLRSWCKTDENVRFFHWKDVIELMNGPHVWKESNWLT